jgi:predicted amidohydrolase YtcJ
MFPLSRVVRSVALSGVLWLAGCARAPEATLIMAGGPIWSLESDQPAEALALRGDTVLGVGSREAMEAFRGPATEQMELDGAAVLPAFVDHHLHILNLGLALLNQEEKQRFFLEVGDVGSLEEVGELVAARAAEAKPGEWILGQGWSQASWGTQALPDSPVLGRAAPNNPVFLTRSDAHTGWANSAALAAAGLTPGTPDPHGGRLVRRADGTLTGILLERAVEPVLAQIPPPSTEDMVRAFRRGAEELAARGVTRAYDAGFLSSPGIVDLLTDFSGLLDAIVADDALRPLPVEVGLMIPGPSALAEAVLAEPGKRLLSPRLRVTHLKLFADGALGARSAALTHPYADDPTTSGVARMSAEEIREWSGRALDAGLDVATHAIGDAAVAATLDAYQDLLAEHPGLDPRRLRIEHISYASQEDFSRAVELGIPLSIQSDFNSPPGERPTFGEMRVGMEHGADVYPWGRLADQGALLLEGTDLYALPGPVLLNLYSALTAQNALGVRGNGAAGRLPAIRMATRFLPPGGAPPQEGRLRVGAPADLVVLSGDPLTTPLSDFLALRVLTTFRHGQKVFGDR